MGVGKHGRLGKELCHLRNLRGGRCIGKVVLLRLWLLGRVVRRVNCVRCKFLYFVEFLMDIIFDGVNLR